MGKRTFLRAAAVIALVLCLCGSIYLALTSYYKNRFAPGIWINGLYCTGMDVGQAAGALARQEESYELCLYDEAYRESRITGGDIAYRRDYSPELSAILEAQPKGGFIQSYLKPHRYRVQAAVSFDPELLKKEVYSFPCVKRKGSAIQERARIVKESGGFELKVEGVRAVDREKLFGLVFKAVGESRSELYLDRLNAYREVEPDEETKAVYEQFLKIDEIQSTKITYVINGGRETLSRGDIAGFIRTGEDGSVLADEGGRPVLDEEKIKDYVNTLADEYDTVGASRVWNKMNGGTVVIEGGTYGLKIDRKAETRELLEALYAGESIARSPVLEKTPAGKVRGEDEIGNTFIEIDITAQMLYYYVNGNLYTQTAVVTGNLARKHGTPARVCYVYNKQKGRILKGPGYASYVNYWMPVLGNIGLHDAAWRREFGGDIYKTSGSHGCINLPKDQAKMIFEKVEIGTPVIMYY